MADNTRAPSPGGTGFDKKSPVPAGKGTNAPGDSPHQDLPKEWEKRYKELIEDIQDIVYVVDRNGKIAFLNRAAESFLGYARQELVGRSFREVILPESYDDAVLIFKRQLGGEDAGPFELKFKKKGGEVVVIEVRERLVWKGTRVVEVHGIGRNVTEKKRAERRLIESERRYRLLVDKANDLIYQTDASGRFTLFNACAVRTTGYTEQEITATHYLDIVHPDCRSRAQRFYGIQFVRNVPDTYFEIPIVTKGGDTLWLGQNVQLIREGNTAVGFSAIARDITDRKRAENALKESAQKYREILENIGEGYYEVDLSGSFTFFNDSMAQILGYPPERLMGMNNREFMDAETAKRVFDTFHDVYETTMPAKALDWELIRKDGGKSYVEVSVSLMTDPMGRPVGFCGIARDITDRKKFEQELQRLSITDSLTGLFNQRHFYARIDEEAKRAARMRYPLSLILFDLDNLKSYNDTYGHLAGDEVLKEIGKITLECIRQDNDSAFRYGGDEFAVILPSTSDEDAQSVAERIRKGVITTIQGMDISIGISSLSKDASVTDIVRAADSRMYAEKGLHKNPPD